MDLLQAQHAEEPKAWAKDLVVIHQGPQARPLAVYEDPRARHPGSSTGQFTDHHE